MHTTRPVYTITNKKHEPQYLILRGNIVHPKCCCLKNPYLLQAYSFTPVMTTQSEALGEKRSVMAVGE